jgi:hypothetical protein
MIFITLIIKDNLVFFISTNYLIFKYIIIINFLTKILINNYYKLRSYNDRILNLYKSIIID